MAYTEDIYDPFTAYMKRLGLGERQYLNPAERYQAGLGQEAGPLQTMYGVQGRMASMYPEQAPGLFEDYGPRMAGSTYGSPDMYAYAGSLLRRIFGTGTEGRQQMGTVWEPTWSEGEMTNRGNIGELQQLLQTALRQNLGRPGANWLAGNLPAEQQRWAGGLAQGGTGTFLDYIRQKYNLQGLGL